jgi:hypothetical protein
VSFITFSTEVSEVTWAPRPTDRSQLTRPRARVVTQRLGEGTPWFVSVSARLRYQQLSVKAAHRYRAVADPEGVVS